MLANQLNLLLITQLMEIAINDAHHTLEWLQSIQQSINKEGVVAIHAEGRHIVKCISLADIIKRECPTVQQQPSIYKTEKDAKSVSHINIQLTAPKGTVINIAYKPTFEPIKK